VGYWWKVSYLTVQMTSPSSKHRWSRWLAMELCISTSQSRQNYYKPQTKPQNASKGTHYGQIWFPEKCTKLRSEEIRMAQGSLQHGVSNNNYNIISHVILKAWLKVEWCHKLSFQYWEAVEAMRKIWSKGKQCPCGFNLMVEHTDCLQTSRLYLWDGKKMQLTSWGGWMHGHKYKM